MTRILANCRRHVGHTAHPAPITMLAISLVAALAATLALAVNPAPAVAATDYPSWDDVKRARSDEAATATQIDTLTRLVADLQTTSDALRLSANQSALDYQVALEASMAAEQEASDLRTRLDEASTATAASGRRAGAVVATLVRANTGDVPLELFAATDEQTADTLYRLGALAKMTERSATVLDAAKQDANQVAVLTAQAEEAASVFAEKKQAAETALAAATAAADAAEAALDEQKAREATLVEQLAFLKNTRIETEAGYQKGVAERAAKEAAEKAARAAKAAAEKAARDAAARSAPGVGGAATGPAAPPVSAGAGSYFMPSSQGWWRPVPGGVTSPYGPRKIICNGAGCSTSFHDGVDVAGSCGTAIRAVSSGTVVFAGNAGAFGNRVIVDHGGGVQTLYGHMQAGSLRVAAGQSVAAGATVGSVGATGVVTGCHLDIKVLVGGSGTNPSSFLRGKGVTL